MLHEATPVSRRSGSRHSPVVRRFPSVEEYAAEPPISHRLLRVLSRRRSPQIGYLSAGSTSSNLGSIRSSLAAIQSKRTECSASCTWTSARDVSIRPTRGLDLTDILARAVDLLVEGAHVGQD
jgi:hypothetical protein